MKVVWTPQARADRDDIWLYIAADDPSAAARMDQVFSDAAASLSDLLLRGRSGAVSGTRELIRHRSYRLIYEVVGETVWILALIHTSRAWPPVRG